ncbi:MAG: hypothetical protein G01um101430_713 [Parcubacteria group bacterium Gr01-1014_30]|nr:MAG: hypothetical protein G01um101430_713 [Parcubacteria group bacterium Gr01-1014_30]
MTKLHDVRLDQVMPKGNPRLTCFTPGCNRETLVCKTEWGAIEWNAALREFKTRHPFKGTGNKDTRFVPSLADPIEK